VRDAFRKIVLENQDHSAMLDKLLPELRQSPSKRSEALDWLDVELARLSDDRVIELIDRLKLARVDSWNLERKARPHSRSRFPRSLWPMMGAAATVFMVLTYGWASAQREAHLDRARANELESKVISLSNASNGIRKMIGVLSEEEVPDRAEWIEQTKILIQLWSQAEGNGSGHDDNDNDSGGAAPEEPGSSDG
jgi:hypothetical protein